MSDDGSPARFTAAQIVIKRAVITAATGLVTFLITNVAHQSTLSQLWLSTYLGGVALLVQFLIDFEHRLEGVETGSREHHDEINTLVERRMAAVEDGLREHRDQMISLVERRMRGVSQVVDLFERTSNRQELIELFRNAVEIEPTSRLRYDFAHGEIRRMTRLLEELSHGNVASASTEENEWLLGLTRVARASIDATSLPNVDAGAQGYTDGFWKSEAGLRYLQAQKDAVGRGVEIRRIFVLNRSIPADDPSLRAVCQEHLDRGVDVKVLLPDRLPSLPPSGVTDFILFDSEMCYQVTTAAQVGQLSEGPPQIVGTQLVLRREAVEDHRGHFEQLWSAAQSVRELDAQPTT
jgi:hypothetical protein